MAEVREDLKAYVHPGKVPAVQDIDPLEWIRLDRNESRFGVAGGVKAVLEEGLDTISSYPENTGRRLRDTIASHYDVKPEEVIIGNGSFELIWLIASLYLGPGREMIVPGVTFGAYRTYTRLSGAKGVAVPLTNDYRIDLDGILEKITDQTSVIWFCNPNNPTGHYYRQEELAEFLKKVPDHVLVVIDEAYVEFVEEYRPSRTIDFIHQYNNVVLLRTFSKFYGLASLRIGYALANREIINTLYAFRIGPNHSRIAEEAARVSLTDWTFQSRIYRAVREEKKYLYEQFDRLHVEYLPTQSNFYSFRIEGVPVKDIQTKLKEKKILIKDGAQFGFEGWGRATIGRREDNEKLVAVLEEIVKEKSQENE